jgi:hypothetical protein
MCSSLVERQAHLIEVVVFVVDAGRALRSMVLVPSAIRFSRSNSVVAPILLRMKKSY